MALAQFISSVDSGKYRKVMFCLLMACLVMYVVSLLFHTPSVFGMLKTLAFTVTAVVCGYGVHHTRLFEDESTRVVIKDKDELDADYSRDLLFGRYAAVLICLNFAVLIVGALFESQFWPGGRVMLTVTVMAGPLGLFCAYKLQNPGTKTIVTKWSLGLLLSSVVLCYIHSSGKFAEIKYRDCPDLANAIKENQVNHSRLNSLKVELEMEKYRMKLDGVNISSELAIDSLERLILTIEQDSIQ